LNSFGIEIVRPPLNGFWRDQNPRRFRKQRVAALKSKFKVFANWSSCKNADDESCILPSMVAGNERDTWPCDTMHQDKYAVKYATRCDFRELVVQLHFY
jgi:hypothetical protein